MELLTNCASTIIATPTPTSEAFKSGLYDVHSENDPSRWQTGYDIPAVRAGRIVKESFPDGLPKLSSGFVFNTRRPIFSDIRVREAIMLLFDAEWVNHNFYFDLYRRSAGFFPGSELSAYHRAADERERALLKPYPDAVRADVLDGTWSPPATDGSGRDRASLRRALALLAAAGYELKETTLRERGSGRPFRFEIMVTSRDEERLALAFASNLGRAGIAAQVRLVDAVQYDQRRVSFDFDMIEYRWEQSLSPGNEQTFYWGLGRGRRARDRATIWARAALADRRHDRRPCSARPRAPHRLGRRRARARPRPHLRFLCRAAVLSSRAMGGALVLRRPSGANVALRLPAGNLVASTETGAGMILGDPAHVVTAPITGCLTIDGLFRQIARRQPDALALADPPNREAFTDGAPRRLTYAEADRTRSPRSPRSCGAWRCRPTVLSACNCPISPRIS